MKTTCHFAMLNNVLHTSVLIWAIVGCTIAEPSSKSLPTQAGALRGLGGFRCFRVGRDRGKLRVLDLLKFLDLSRQHCRGMWLGCLLTHVRSGSRIHDVVLL